MFSNCHCEHGSTSDTQTKAGHAKPTNTGQWMTGQAGHSKTRKAQRCGNTRRHISRDMPKCGEQQAHMMAICSIGVSGYEPTLCSTGCWENFSKNRRGNAAGANCSFRIETLWR